MSGLWQLKLANQILAEEQHQPMYKVRNLAAPCNYYFTDRRRVPTIM